MERMSDNMPKYERGQHVFILASNNIVQELVVRSSANHIYTLALTQSGQIQIPEERLFSDRETAEEHMKQMRQTKKGRLTYMEKISTEAI